MPLPFSRPQGLQEEPPSTPLEGDELLPEEVNLHSTLPTQTAIKSGGFISHLPRQGVQDTGTIDFRIVSGTNEFIDPWHTYVGIKFRILNATGNTIDAVAGGAHNVEINVLPVNGLTYAAFRTVNTKINGTTISWGGEHYPYRGDIETRLSYPKNIKEHCLKLSGFDEEETAFEDIDEGNLHFDEATTETHPHQPLLRRYLRSKASKTCFLIGKIHSEIFDQPKLLPPNTVFDIIFDRSDSKFVVLTKRNTQYKLKIDECILISRMVDMDEQVTEDIMRINLAGTSFLYPVRRVKIRPYTVSPRVTSLGSPNLLLGEGEILPRRMFIVMVKQSAMGGHYKQDPFNYQPFHAQLVCLKIGSHEAPFPVIKCDPANGDVAEALFYLLLSNGSLFSSGDLGLDYRNFTKRNFILGFDLTGTLSPPGLNFEVTKEYNMSLVIDTSEELDEAVNVIIYAEYDSEIEILSNKKVIKHDYA